MQEILGQYVVGILCALAATAFFGVTNVIYKKLDQEISVVDIIVTRVWVSFPLAYFFAVGTTGSISISLPPDSLIPLALSMIVGIIIGDTMYFLSQERIGVVRAFPLVMSYPLVVYLMAALFLEEPVILQRIIGAVIVVVGVVIISRAEYADDSETSEEWSRRDKKIGLLFAFFTIIFWAAGDVIFQFGLTSAGVAEANYFRMLVASIIFLPIFLISLRGGRKLPTLKVSYVAIVAGLIGFGASLILYSFAIKFIGATVTSVLVASAPVMTAPLSALYLQEDINKKIGMGTILTILGILLVVVIF